MKYFESGDKHHKTNQTKTNYKEKAMLLIESEQAAIDKSWKTLHFLLPFVDVQGARHSHDKGLSFHSGTTTGSLFRLVREKCIN